MYPEDGVIDRDSPVDNGLGRLKINLEKIVFGSSGVCVG